MSQPLDPTAYPAYAAECGDPSRTKRLGFGNRAALLLVDVCEAYFSHSSPLALDLDSQQRVAKAIASLIQAARGDAAGTVPIIYAQTIYTHPDCRDAGLQKVKNKSAYLFQAQHPDHLTAPPLEHPALHPEPLDLRLTKKYPSPFFGTNLATQLTAMGVDTLVIVGFTTSGGIRASALDAMQSGFRPMVVVEAVADRGHESHWANLMDVGAKYGDVVSLEAGVEALSTRSL
ncbi:Isochorismatase hydrolase [Thozetella sp. PMI_491]|nr:Isochorismatase hydrolase [Thozetella sp. PMI_491]